MFYFISFRDTDGEVNSQDEKAIWYVAKSKLICYSKSFLMLFINYFKSKIPGGNHDRSVMMKMFISF